MRYASIRKMDISNGEGVRISLFVQGCSFHCKGCFNSETWDFNGGKEFTQKEFDLLMKLGNSPYIRGLSLLGGEPLHPNNINTVTQIAKKFKELYPEKDIWLWSGYIWEDYIKDKEIIKYIDVIVDGQFEEDKKDFSLHFCGSYNQRLISVKDTLREGKVIFYKH